MARKIILIFSFVMLACIAAIYMMFGHVPNVVFFNLGFTLLIAPSIGCSMVLLMKTIVMEKQKSTQLFIMSLPVTVKEFITAKLLLNFPVFAAFWLVITGVAFYFSFGLGVFPYGAVPFMTMIFLGIFVAYVGILSVALIYQSYGITVIAMLGVDWEHLPICGLLLIWNQSIAMFMIRKWFGVPQQLPLWQHKFSLPF